MHSAGAMSLCNSLSDVPFSDALLLAKLDMRAQMRYYFYQSSHRTCAFGAIAAKTKENHLSVEGEYGTV